MEKKIDLSRYQIFVDGVTSQPSKNLEDFIDRIQALDQSGLDVPRALTAGVGLAGETGEFNELVKKIVFHGKEYSEDNRLHMKKELGDIIWYWVNACTAAGFDPNEVIAENVAKLEARYPGGRFDSWYSENRAENDI